MKNTKRKGFTIVELVIVIAVIAILAAVLIPTFASLVNKANQSKDTQLVKNLNTALASDDAKEHKTMGEALAAAEAFGYDVAKINASATDNAILWDSANDVFCYLNDGEIEYIPDSLKGEKPADYKYWQICTEMPDAQKYSIYWNTEDALPEGKTLTVGFESGKYATDLDLTYANSGDAQEVVIRTNGGTLTINAENDTVHHYGNAASVDINAINTASYHAYGTVGHIKLTKGHVVVENGAEVSFISKGDSSTDTSVTNNGTLGMAPGFDTIEGNQPETTSTGGAKTQLSTEGGYVKLTSDQTINDDLTLSKDTVLDLAGFTITFEDGKALNITSNVTVMDTEGGGAVKGKVFDSAKTNLVVVKEGGCLTLNSGKIEGTHVASNNGYYAMISVKDGATLVINGGEISTEKDSTTTSQYSNSAVLVVGKGTGCYINGGKINAEANFALTGNGSETHWGTYIEINGGTLKSGNDIAVYHPQVGTMNINGGKFIGASALYQKAGTVNITGGVFEANGSKNDYKYNGNGGNSTGDCIIVDSCEKYGSGAPVLNISLSNTKITSKNAAKVAGYIYGTDTEAVIVWNGESVKSIKVD